MHRRSFLYQAGCGAAGTIMVPELLRAFASESKISDHCSQFFTFIGAIPTYSGTEVMGNSDILFRLKPLKDIGYTSNKIGWYQLSDFLFCPVHLEANCHSIDTKVLVFQSKGGVTHYCGTISQEFMSLCLVHGDSLKENCPENESVSSLCIPLKTIQSGSHGTVAYQVGAGTFYLRQVVDAQGVYVSGWLKRGEKTFWKAESQNLHPFI